METVYCPVALSLSFQHNGGMEIRHYKAKTLYSFKILKDHPKAVAMTLIASDGAVATSVWHDSFERLTTGYSWVEFNSDHVLATAKRRSNESWQWQPGTVAFEAGGVYAVKMLPPDAGQTDSCNFQTKDRKIFPYVDRRYFSVVSVVSEMRNSTLPRVLEAFPLPIPGVQRAHDPGVWDVPMEYDSIPVTYEDHVFSRFKHATIKPVAALRLEFDDDKNPVYRCSYFGPALK